jgi:hypothetical protein
LLIVKGGEKNMTERQEDSVQEHKDRPVQSFTDYGDRKAMTDQEPEIQAAPAVKMNPYEMYGEDYYSQN